MTERQGTVEGETVQVPDDLWRIEGSESSDYGDGGLGDTVVRIPKITDDGTEIVPPALVKPRPTRRRTGNTGTQRAVGADGLPVPAKADAPAAVPPAAPAAPGQPAVTDPAPTRLAAPVVAEPTPVQPAVAPASPFAEPGPVDRQAPAAFAVPPVVAPVVNPYGPPAVAATPAAPAAAVPVAKPKASGHHRSRKARLRLSKVDPWSVMKTSFLFSIAFGIMFWVSVSVVWTVVVNSGIFDAINQAVVNILSSPTSQTTWKIEDYVNTNKVLGITALLAVVNVVISTALGTLAAFLYNLSANILGGLELTLSEDT